MRVVRKLLTKPIWCWERKRSYPVRDRYLTLPSLAVNKGPSRLVVLTTPASINDALWAAWSWYRYLQPENFDLHLAIDGCIAESEKLAAQRLFPGASVYSVEPLIASLCETWPGLKAFIGNHPLGRKLGLLLALSDQGPLLYSDHDVLAFDTPVELLSMARKDLACYIMEECEGNWDSVVLERARELGLNYFSKFNSGLLQIPHGALSIHLAEKLLETWRASATSWFTEQTVLNVLMRYTNAHALPNSRYVITNRRQFYFEKDVDYTKIAARHFTGTVRHVMYGTGIPTILRQSKLHTKQLR